MRLPSGWRSCRYHSENPVKTELLANVVVVLVIESEIVRYFRDGLVFGSVDFGLEPQIENVPAFFGLFRQEADLRNAQLDERFEEARIIVMPGTALNIRRDDIPEIPIRE